ncbi:MAG: hypothetical protein JNK20_07180 [Flavipsychrobacter sp.]|nr:hypothetical protein [Flavipsychrobacter sp.]
MYSFRASVLIGIILAVPFFLRYKGFEPYPAVLLPDGAVTATSVTYSLLYARTMEGNWQELPPAQFFHPIPVQYSSHLIRSIGNSYKADSMSSRSILLRKLHMGDRFQPDALAKTNANNWVKQQLFKLKMDTTVIMLRTYQQQLVPNNTGVRQKTIEHEQVIELGK